MKKRIIAIVLGVLGGFCLAGSSTAQDITKDELMKELKAMKAKIEALEKRIRELEGTEEVAKAPPEAPAHYHSVKGLADRVKRLEAEIQEKGATGQWAKKVRLSGTLEVETNYERMDYDDPGIDDTTTSDITLSTAELDVDVDVTHHVGGHVAFLWEEDDTEPVDIDEGFIIIDGKDKVPLYLNAGKMYVPFGYYESHFISDPITNSIGETNQSAIKVGFAKYGLDLCGAVFNGDVDETGDDDRIDGYVGSIRWTASDGMLPGMGLTAGVSYISNIGDSDGLEGELPGTIRRHVDGIGSFLSLSFMDKYFVELEYIGALDEFQAGELSFAGGKKAKPRAWNTEFALRPVEGLEVGFRYERSDDLGDFEPENQWGAVVNYSIFENTSVALEYLHGKYETQDKRDLITGQLAVTF